MHALVGALSGSSVQEHVDDQQPGTAASHASSQGEPVDLHLQRVPSEALIMFPDTAEGYVSQVPPQALAFCCQCQLMMCELSPAVHEQVRWHSFQFLLEELAEEVEEMLAIEGDMLQKLPRPFHLAEQ